MRTLLLIFVAGLFSFSGHSQDVSINVLFEKEGVETAISNLSAKLILDNDTVVASTQGNSISIPKNLFGKKGKTVICINNTTFTFDNFVVAWNDELLVWKIDVDYKPFDKEKYWTIRNWKKIKVIYSLDYGNGKQLTEYRFKKL